MSALKSLGAIAAVTVLVAMCASHQDSSRASKADQPRPPPPPSPESAFAKKVQADGAMNIVGNILSREYLKYLGGKDDFSNRFRKNFERPLVVYADDLFRKSSENIAAVDREYRGKRLLISGRVLEIHPGYRKSEYIVSLPGGFAVFHDDDGFVATLATGKEAQFICVYEPGLASSGYGLDGCRSKSRVADQVAGMIVLQPSMVGSDGDKAIQAMKEHAKLDGIPADSPCLRTVDVRACFGGDVEQQVESEALDAMREALMSLPAPSAASD